MRIRVLRDPRWLLLSALASGLGCAQGPSPGQEDGGARSEDAATARDAAAPDAAALDAAAPDAAAPDSGSLAHDAGVACENVSGAYIWTFACNPLFFRAPHHGMCRSEWMRGFGLRGRGRASNDDLGRDDADQPRVEGRVYRDVHDVVWRAALVRLRSTGDRSTDAQLPRNGRALDPGRRQQLLLRYRPAGLRGRRTLRQLRRRRAPGRPLFGLHFRWNGRRRGQL